MLNHGTRNINAPFPGLFVCHPVPESAEDAENSTVQQMFRGVEQALSLNVKHPLALNILQSTELWSSLATGATSLRRSWS